MHKLASFVYIVSAGCIGNCFSSLVFSIKIAYNSIASVTFFSETRIFTSPKTASKQYGLTVNTELNNCLA